MAAYHHAGISSDRRTWARPAPLLPGLAAALRADGTPPAITLADRLVPYTEGTHSALFAAPTTTRPAGHLIVFTLRDLPDELKADRRRCWPWTRPGGGSRTRRPGDGGG